MSLSYLHCSNADFKDVSDLLLDGGRVFVIVIYYCYCNFSIDYRF